MSNCGLGGEGNFNEFEDGRGKKACPGTEPGGPDGEALLQFPVVDNFPGRFRDEFEGTVDLESWNRSGVLIDRVRDSAGYVVLGRRRSQWCRESCS